MELVIVGSGTGAPSARRGAPCQLVRLEGCTLLFDTGPGSLNACARLGLDYAEPDALFYTHYHPDHVTDLISYLFAARYDAGFTRAQPAVVYGPPGLYALASALAQAFGRWVEPLPGRVELREIGPGQTLGLAGGRVETFPIRHRPNSLGYRLTDEAGFTLAISGDTGPTPELVELAQGARALLTECSFPEGRGADHHLTPGQAGRAAREAGVETLILTHFYPECDASDILTPAAAEFKGRIILAEDGLTLSP